MSSETLGEEKNSGDGSPPGDEEEAKDRDPATPDATVAAAAAAAAAEGVGEEEEEGAKVDGEEVVEKKRRGSVEKEPATPVEKRPSRERKAVERYTSASPRSSSAKKSPAILQGFGTMLKDIPNVSFKMSRRKADENLQVLHRILFGKKSNAHSLKRNILQFSGFVWDENEVKQKAKLKEKLDRCHKEKLLDFCELLDVHDVKTATKKEEISAKLSEFLESPYVTRDVLLSEKQKKFKKHKRSKGLATSNEPSLDREEKRQRKSSKQSVEAEKGNEEDHSADSEEESREQPKEEEEEEKGNNEDSEKETDHVMSDQEESQEDEQEKPATSKKASKEVAQKNTGSKGKEKAFSAEEAISTNPAKSPKSASKIKVAAQDKPADQLEDKSSKELKKVSKSSSKGRDAPPKSNKTNKGALESTPSKRSRDEAKLVPSTASKSKNKDKSKSQSKSSSTENKKTSEKSAAKAEPKVSATKQRKGKANGDAPKGPSTEELHAVVSEILKEVDFNTATLADILRQLGAHFNVDLMDRKAEVKHIIEEVINNMSDDDDDDDGNDDDDQEDEDGEEDAQEEEEDNDSDGDDGK
uniref:DEK-C domain-containing protein n=1 Tax=Ananas comosus var. bracteatus TaxID=296719 RepID=A0A6V7QSK8_ANACO